MNLTITQEPVTAPTSLMLIRELLAVFDALYGDDEGGVDSSLPTLQGERSVFLVAWVDGEAVGCGAIRPMADERYAEIKRMYVRRAWRGCGISRRVLTTLEAQARVFGYHHLKLETGILQPEAIGLYESAGFVRIPNYGKYEGDEMSVCYEKEL